MANDPSVPLSPNESVSGPALLGVDLGSNQIRLGAVAKDGTLQVLQREPYSDQSRNDSRALADHLLSVTRQMIHEQPGIEAIGVAFPGMVHQKDHRVVELAALPSLSKIDLYKEFKEAFDRPVHFENNANAAAFAEQAFGVGAGENDYLYLHIGANVSVGLFLNGKLQRGASGLAGALGNMKIYAEHIGESVPLDSMVSAENIVRRTQQRLKRDSTSSLSRLGVMGGFSYDDIIAAAAGGDDLAKIMLQRTGMFIAIALSDVISLLNLSLIAVAGAPAGRNFLVPAISTEVKRRVSEEAYRDCKIVAAEIGAEAGVIGAALLAGERV